MKYVKIIFISNAIFLTIIMIIDLILGKYEHSYILVLIAFYFIAAVNSSKAYTKFLNPKLLKIQLIFLSVTSLTFVWTPFLDPTAEAPFWLYLMFVIVIICSILIIAYSTVKTINIIHKKSDTEYEKKFMDSIIIVVAIASGLGIAYIINSVLK